MFKEPSVQGAARANFKEDGGNLLAPVSMELTGSIAAAATGLELA